MTQPIGPPASTGPATFPTREPLHGRYTSVVPLEVSHAKTLFKHVGGQENAHLWTYLFQEPFLDSAKFEEAVTQWSASKDPLYFAVLSAPASDPAAEPVGFLTYMSIVPDHLRIELGSVCFGEKLKRTRQATEAFYMLKKRAFEELGYSRFEWKANNLNAPSLAAAGRLGFVFEGVFRKHMVIKGRRRDTAWFSITDDEWPAVKCGLEAWLSDENFDEQGKQRKALKQCREDFAAAQA
ncbi:GNAT family acetyltransferase [Colletotrichum plurivorum]|uniref:GNAT family acetyltransferase n=1 Tax=Colletotrichum plurivorum TaxID=2175906 RepID=A0A8H6K5S4_9PEZI|nr:GNAT family acetyltransferase [Colletotrichum plurivorum]